MDKYKEAIREYEESRQLIIELSKKKSKLVSECSNWGKIKKGYGTVRRDICLIEALKEYKASYFDEYYHDGSHYEYHEILEHGNQDGIYCDNCVAAHKLKRGDLADAKKAFGNAKRRLSALGKQLIKNKVQ